MIHSGSTFGESGLHIAVEHQSHEAARVLISQGIDLNAENHRVGMPLHYACYYSDPEMAALLVDAGADVEAQRKYDSTNGAHTPLHNAVWGGNPDIAKMLLDHGADPNAVSNFWRVTPLFMAISSVRLEKNRVRSVEVLLEYGADPGIVSADNGESIMDWLEKSNLISEPEKLQLTNILKQAGLKE